MGWVTWSILGYFMNAVALAVDKVLLGRRELGNPAVYTIFISVLGLMVLVLAPWGWQWPTSRSLWLGLASGACFTLGLWAMFSVLKYGEASRVPAFIGALGPIFVFCGSWWLMGETLTPGELGAFVLLVVGGFAMVGGSGGLHGRRLLPAVGASACFGLAYVLLKLTFAESNFISALILTRVGGFVVSLLLLAAPGAWAGLRGGVQAAGVGLRLAFLSGQAAGAVAGLLTSYAITLGSVTLVNALQGVQYVFLLGLALGISWRAPQLFRDEFSGASAARKVLGTGLIVGGLSWLALVV